IGREVDARAAVIRLQVDDANAVERAEPLQEQPVPVLLGIELELEPACDLAPPLRRGPRRDDEANRTLLASECSAEAKLVLSQCEVEGGALERPTAIALCQRLDLVEAGGGQFERPAAAELEVARHAVVHCGVVGDVLALAGHPVAMH